MRTIVYGNGKSRQKWNVNEELDNVVTWGCNRIFNDVKVDNLVAVDYHVQHLIYESGYAHENKCWFTGWTKLPEDFYENQISMLPKLNIIENEKRNRNHMVVNGKQQEPNKGLYITWVDENDMVEDIDFPKEWSSGTTAIHLACQQGATEIYLMGFDLSENPLNNVYGEIQKQQKMTSIHQWVKGIDPHNFWHRSDWAQEIKTVMQEFRDTEFIWVEPHDDTMKFDMNNLTYDTYENIRSKICR